MNNEQIQTNPIQNLFQPIDRCCGLQFGIYLFTPAKPCVKLYVPHRGFRPKQLTVSPLQTKKFKRTGSVEKLFDKPEYG